VPRPEERRARRVVRGSGVSNLRMRPMPAEGLFGFGWIIERVLRVGELGRRV